MKLKRIAILLLAAIATFATGAKAQVAPTVPPAIVGSIPMPAGMNHPTAPFGQIDGKQNPEQITDDVAFRFLMSDLLTVNDANPNGIITEPLLAQIGLSDAGTDALRTTVLSYTKNLNALVTVNNNANGGSPTFWRDVYALVYNTRLGLAVQLSTDDVTAFTNYLQIHKQNLSVSPYDIGLGDAAKINLREVGAVASAAGAVPQGVQMTSNYGSSTYTTFNFPAVFINNSPFWSGWAQDTGSGTGYFGATSNGQIIPTTSNDTTNNQSDAYWPSGGYSVVGMSNMILGVAPYNDAAGNGNAIGVRTSISNNGVNYYMAEFSNYGNTVYLLKRTNGKNALLGSWPLPAQFSAAFQPGDQLTLVSINHNIDVIYIPANAGNYSGEMIDIIHYYDPTPLPAGYVGIQECDCGGLATYAGWTGGTGFSLTVSASVNGNTLGSGWPPTTRHTPIVSNTKGSLGNRISGQAVPPSNYVNFNNTQTYTYDLNGADDGLDFYNIETWAEIFCSQVGQFYGAGGNPFTTTQDTRGSSQGYGDWVPCWAPAPGDLAPGCGGGLNFVWLAITYLHTITFDTTTNTYSASLNCTGNTTPPDAIPPASTIIQNWRYRVQNWRYFAICSSISIDPPYNFQKQFSCWAAFGGNLPNKMYPVGHYNPMPAPDLDALELIKGHSTPQYCTHHASSGLP